MYHSLAQITVILITSHLVQAAWVLASCTQVPFDSLPVSSSAFSTASVFAIDADGGEDSENDLSPREYVRRSLDLIQQNPGSEKEVLDELERIACTDTFESYYATEALFHLGANDTALEARLIRILQNDKSSMLANVAVCKMLSLGAGKKAREVLMKRVFGSSHLTSVEDAIWALMDLGHEPFLDNFAAKIANWPPEVKRLWQSHLKTAKASLDKDRLLSLISSSDTLVYRKWAILLASRRGASVSEIRNAILKYLRRADIPASSKRSYDCVWAGLRLGVFTDADEKEFMEIRQRVEFERSNSHSHEFESMIPWANRREIVRERVYRMVR